eukprot:CAMPEP_0114556492 /NCGR_PEP_ID=MMETSP0114-20121206/9320_1 /TAXON_ID=31324 /ORGANISM="Goniomonas sp, Strain m" /LENGTH=212 /DNA_ID=CAMNT_0001741705 /DNA_START=6 /DNA_END=644 /DNA_ORIENTATION=-
MALAAAYLVAYNGVCWAAWGWVFVNLCMELYLGLSSWPRVGNAVVLLQSIAFLEVVHGAVGITRTPVSAAFPQFFARGIVTFVAFSIPEVQRHTSIDVMLVAWSLTEIVRYLYYGINASWFLDPPAWLIWARYTTFLPLYPLGAIAECWLIVTSFQYQRVSPLLPPPFGTALLYFCYAYSVIIWPGLAYMYTYMLKMRKRNLSPKSGGKKQH